MYVSRVEIVTISTAEMYMDISEKQKEGFITLKEASALSGYSSDYIGQLIRKGKLDGRQVYANVAWMTTREALMEYMDSDTARVKSAPDALSETTLLSRLINIDLLPHQSGVLRPALIIISVFSVLFLLVEFYLFSVFIDRRLTLESEVQSGETIAAARALVASVNAHDVR
jgi:hypothetical protein